MKTILSWISLLINQTYEVSYQPNLRIDKRGRPVSHTSSEDLRRYYELDSEESSDEPGNEIGKYVKAPSSLEEDEDNNQLDIKHASDKSVSENVKRKLKNLNIDYARGESKLFSDSSSDDDEESEEDEDDTLEHAWGALDNDAPHTDEVTHRLAACNMDWDRIKAVDLMVLLSSFLPPGGIIQSVSIYPSEFGKERMREEEVKGPVELVECQTLKNDKENEEESNDEGEGSKYHMEKLRLYQLNRLKYYYAVIVCDNKNSSNKIYSECDGLEYESSATKMDLRFIPDDMTFDDVPKEVCEKLPDQGKYKPRFFTTTALQQAKVDLTWDETNPDRIEFTQKLAAGDEVAKNDLDAYLASSSNEEEEDEGNEIIENTTNNSKTNAIDKYKALLQDIETKEKEKESKGVEMEVSWDIDLKNKTESLVKKKIVEKEERTPFQEYLEKRREKQKMKREERKKMSLENNLNETSDSDIPSDVDLNDTYFAEEFNTPEFKQKSKKSPSVKTREEDEGNTAELELLLSSTDDSKNHFNLKKIQDRENINKTKKKLKNKEVSTKYEDDFQINVEDKRFSALYTSHHFNVDPTDPHYKKTKGMEAIVTEKLKRKDSSINDIDTNVPKRNAELSVLVKSVKRKTEALSNKKKRKL
ncbi:hypothetical protein FQR65_LT10834 [Abscondita terminalis]|nr:hypothetical protein FQR65_LT10834 [Abscondita terminalis]